MNIEADALRYDDLKQTSVFTGNVVVTKGTIVIRGARIDVRQDPEGYQYGVVTAAPGKLAYFRQKRDAPARRVDRGRSRGHRIRQPRRQREVHPPRRDAPPASAPRSTTRPPAPLIVYDQSNDTFTVNGAPLPPSGSVGRQRPAAACGRS